MNKNIYSRIIATLTGAATFHAWYLSIKQDRNSGLAEEMNKTNLMLEAQKEQLNKESASLYLKNDYTKEKLEALTGRLEEKSEILNSLKSKIKKTDDPYYIEEANRTIDDLSRYLKDVLKSCAISAKEKTI